MVQYESNQNIAYEPEYSLLHPVCDNLLPVTERRVVTDRRPPGDTETMSVDRLSNVGVCHKV